MTKFDYCLLKLAAELQSEGGPPPDRWKNVAKIIGGGLLGLAGGHLAGVGAGKAIEHMVDRAGGNSADVARKIMPVAGGALGILYPMWKAREQQELKDAFQGTNRTTVGNVPGK